MRRSVAEHQQAVLEVLARAWESAGGAPLLHDAGTRVPLGGLPGRVLAGALVAPLDLPPFANSQMDGFAIWADPAKEQPKAVDSVKSTTYRATTTIPAGVVPPPLDPGTAAPIMTGAMLPAGANAVVPVERALPAHFPDAGAKVELPPARPGDFVRSQGSDLAAGSVAIAAGTLLNAAHVGLASALGCTSLQVRRQPRVLLVATGDEVLLPGDPRAAEGLPEGRIFDANTALLRASHTMMEPSFLRSLSSPTKDKPCDKGT